MKKLLMGKHCGELHVALCSITGSNDNTSFTEHLYIYIIAIQKSLNYIPLEIDYMKHKGQVYLSLFVKQSMLK